MYSKFTSVIVGAMLFSSAQAEISISQTKSKIEPVVEAGEHQLTALPPSALLLLSAGLFGIIAVARRESA